MYTIGKTDPGTFEKSYMPSVKQTESAKKVSFFDTFLP